MEAAVSSGESARLRSKLAFALPALRAESARVVGHPRTRELYPEYLITTHFIIRASVPLMQTALNAARGREGDAVAAGLASYLEQHVDEEVGHDEWLLQDLETLGHHRAEVLARLPSPAVAELVGAQYYWVLHYHPVSLFGYIGLLEGYPPTIEDVDRWMAATGYGRDAFRTLIRHAELDPLHAQDMDEALDGLRLTPEQSALVGLSALHSVEAFRRILVELVERADRG